MLICTYTLYNEVWAGSLDLSFVTELPEAAKRKTLGLKPREHRKSFGTDISQRPEIAALRIKAGHWEGDTVGARGLVKRLSSSPVGEENGELYCHPIPSKDADSVLERQGAVTQGRIRDKFSQVFKTITGQTEFSVQSCREPGQCSLFAHPILRGNVPKRASQWTVLIFK